MNKLLDKVNHAVNIKSILEEALNNESVTYEPLVISFINPYSYMRLRSHPEIFNSVDYYYSDAVTSSLIFSMLLFRKISRISFDYGSFARHFLTRLTESELSVYFIGAKHDEINRAVDVIKESFPGVNVAGYRHGYFNGDNEMLAAVNDIVNSGASFVVCGMGTPYQEIFASYLKGNGRGSIRQIYTCGGFLHQTTGSISYYPAWINKFNLRWLFRAFSESYVFKRILVQYPQFLFFSIYDRLSNK